ncbi:MAG: hypothetical protein IPG50_09995 [Myxococcales bacterium]|nr:hypothetical protein [Myxococcales bacterium]
MVVGNLKRSYVRRALALFAALLLVIACGGDDTPAPQVAPTPTGARIAFPPVEKSVGSEGGTLELQDGTTLEIPPGALGASTAIKATLVRYEKTDGTQLRYYYLEPEGLRFTVPAKLRTKVPQERLEAAQVTMQVHSTLHEAKTDNSEISKLQLAKLAEEPPVRSGELAYAVPHFTFYLLAIAVDSPMYLVTDIPAKYLLPGDLLFVLTTIGGGPNWQPGHVGLFTGGRGAACSPGFVDEVVEATAPAVRKHFLEDVETQELDPETNTMITVKKQGTKTGDAHFYLGAKRPSGGLDAQQRLAMATGARALIGRPYLEVGGPLTLYSSFSCVGFTEFLLDAVGKGAIDKKQELIASVPLEQFRNTEYVREITMNPNDRLTMPFYGTVVHPAGTTAFEFTGRYCSGMPCCDGPVCNDYTIEADPATLPPGATFKVKSHGKWELDYLAQPQDAGKTFTIDLTMTSNASLRSSFWGRSDLGILTIKDKFTIKVEPCPTPPDGGGVQLGFSVAPIQAIFTQQLFTTDYSAQITNPTGQSVVTTWSGPDCATWAPQGPSAPINDANANVKMTWAHPHPPCDATTQHADRTIKLEVSGPGGIVECTYPGAESGAGPACTTKK